MELSCGAQAGIVEIINQSIYIKMYGPVRSGPRISESNAPISLQF
jgi:hypothetical protein